MGDKNPIESFEPQTRFQYLPLSALSAIDEEAMLIVFYHLRCKPSVNGWCRSGRSKKNQFEQGIFLLRFVLV